MLRDIILGALLLAVSLALSLLITVPLLGTLVRYRANYTPKAVQLDGNAHVGPVVTSYWQMLLRVRRIEGPQGFYKGLMPTLVSTAILTAAVAVMMGTSPATSHTPGRYSAPDSGSLTLVIYTIVAPLLATPFTVFTNRSIATPHRLPWFNPAIAFRALLTPEERRRPWKLYLIPGLLAAQFSHIIFVVLILHNLRRLVLPSLSTLESSASLLDNISLPRLGIYLVIVALSTAVLSPLEVISTRLSLQRSGDGLSANEGNSLPDGNDVEYAGKDEDVLGLRSESDPYTGLADCAKRIMNEEGTYVLYRAWFVTLVVAFGGALS